MRDTKEEAVQERRAARLGEFIEVLGQGHGTEGLEDGTLKDIRVRFATEEEPSTLLIVRATSREGDHIAFVGAYSAADALLAWRAKDAGPGLKWREDVPWGER